jgi:uncharacterized delta-60 repeat protein
MQTPQTQNLASRTAQLCTGPRGRALHCGAYLALACLALACGSADDQSGSGDVDSDPTGTISSPIYNGTTITEAGSGIIRVRRNGNTGCSGTLLKNNWILTAAHCVRLDYDYAFSPNGIYSGSNDGDAVRAIKLASGKVIYAGAKATATGNKLLIGRLSGTPANGDATFGSVGRAVIDIPGSTSESISAIALQSDGKIVAVGNATIDGSNQFLVARFNTNGSLDTSFDGDGYVTTDITTGVADGARAVAIDSAGKIVVAGTSGSAFAVARYNTAGGLDTTFDRDGKLTTTFSGTSAYGQAVALLGSSILVVGGQIDPASGHVAAALYTSTGALDTSFDSDGKFVFATNASVTSLAIGPSSGIYIGGSVDGTAAVWKITSAGAQDTAFGTQGVIKPTFHGTTGSSEVVALAYSNSTGQPIRAAVDLISSDAGNPHEVGVVSFTPSSGGMFADRIFPESATGRDYGFASSTKPSAIAVVTNGSTSLDRVVVGGTTGSGTTSRSAILSVIPDRSTYTPSSTNPFPMDVAMNPDRFDISRVFLPTGTTGLTSDVALLKTAARALSPGATPVDGFNMGNPPSRSGYNFAGFSTLTTKNRNVHCFGYGYDVLGANNKESYSTSDVLREGFSKLTDLSTNYSILGYRTGTPTPTAQLPFQGDSGGSCRDDNDGKKLVGVQSLGNPTTAFEVIPSKFSSWVTTTMANN